jgi:hypothetical protein
MGTRWIVDFQTIDPKQKPVDPGEFWTVGIPEWLYRKHQHSGNEKALGRLFLVGELLQEKVEQIWEGWSRPGKEDCFAYFGQLARDFKSPQIETPAPPGMIFGVFVLPDGSIDDWTWREQTEEKEGVIRPSGIVKGELIWPLNKTSGSS